MYDTNTPFFTLKWVNISVTVLLPFQLDLEMFLVIILELKF